MVNSADAGEAGEERDGERGGNGICATDSRREQNAVSLICHHIFEWILLVGCFKMIVKRGRVS